MPSVGSPFRLGILEGLTNVEKRYQYDRQYCPPIAPVFPRACGGVIAKRGCSVSTAESRGISPARGIGSRPMKVICGIFSLACTAAKCKYRLYLEAYSRRVGIKVTVTLANNSFVAARYRRRQPSRRPPARNGRQQ